jgi:hypothetical protein
MPRTAAIAAVRSPRPRAEYLIADKGYDSDALVPALFKPP